MKETDSPDGIQLSTTGSLVSAPCASVPPRAAWPPEFPGPHGSPKRPEFAMRFSSTPRGARLARRLAGHRLDAWGMPYGCEAHDTVTLIVAELSANAVQHGRVPGRDFHLRLLRLGADADTRTVRVEVTDTRAERLPVPAVPAPGGEPTESGRGLLLVARLAARWGWHPRTGGPGKTVWAECVLLHSREM